MKKQLYSLAGKLPLVGELHVEFSSCVRGRHLVDINVDGRNLELFIGDTHVVFSADQKGLTALALLAGWLLDFPRSLIPQFLLP